MKKSIKSFVVFATLLLASLAVFAIHPAKSPAIKESLSPVQTFCSTPIQSSCSFRDEYDFPSIAGRSSAELTITVTGAEFRDEVIVTPNGSPEAGLLWGGYVSEDGIVKLRLVNVTNNAINPELHKYRITVNKY